MKRQMRSLPGRERNGNRAGTGTKALQGRCLISNEEDKMADAHRDPYDTDRVVVKRGGAGRTIAIIVVVLALIAAVLFATGFWKADVTRGDMPQVSVKGGDLPNVDVDSKEVVVGTEKKTVDVPTVGVKDNGEK
jgi:hypothetical protein